jgi:Ca-activated chloride channel family protein
MSKNHKPDDRKELQQAYATANALGELPVDEAGLFELNRLVNGLSVSEAESQLDETRRLGHLLRSALPEGTFTYDASSAESRKCSDQVRESVLATLDALETKPTLKPVEHATEVPGKKMGRRIVTRLLPWAITAGIIAIVVNLYLPPRPQMVREAASREVRTKPKTSANSDLPTDLIVQTIKPDEWKETTASPNPDAKGSNWIMHGVHLSEVTPSKEVGGVVESKESGKNQSSGSSNANDQRLLARSVGDRIAPQLGMGAESNSGVSAGAPGGSDDEEGQRNSSRGGLGEIADRGKFDSDDLADLEKTRSSANESYKSIPENPFWRPIGEQAMSTFSVDVDTASYANMRRFLNDGTLPPPQAVRLEEFINYFHYDYPQPIGTEPFAVDLKLFGCPWNAQHSLLRVGLQGREIKAEKRPISNIVYLVDVSGSMSNDDKLPLLKRGLAMMADHLSENDTVSIVTYAGNAGVRLEPTNGSNKKKILEAIDSLQSGGSTNGAAGIDVAYRLAQQNFAKEGANRVILMTDGDLNVGVTSDEALVALIKEKAASGVFLTVLGFGTGNLKDSKLEGLADNGNGIYGYIDSIREAHKVLVEQMSGSLVTIAKDVKIQLEFNPAQVAGYRLIGYENRVMANQDFANDRKDAGEIGAGHTVTALYEIVPVGATLDTEAPNAPTLKYQTVGNAAAQENAPTKADIKLTEAAASGELARVALRYKTPEGTESRLIEFTSKSEVTPFSEANADCRFAAAVAAFGMQLRQSSFAGTTTFDAIAEIASSSLGPDPNGHRAEFVDLVRRAKSLQDRHQR